MVINRSRMMADRQEPFVVFLFGVRLNRLWHINYWLSVLWAMRKMLKELQGLPGSGLLGHEFWYGNPCLSIQYWDSMDALLAYAYAKNARHLPAWVAFKDNYAKSGSVGLWHEAYIVYPGSFDTAYKNMPLFGLGKATAVTLYHGSNIKKNS